MLVFFCAEVDFQAETSFSGADAVRFFRNVEIFLQIRTKDRNIFIRDNFKSPDKIRRNRSLVPSESITETAGKIDYGL